MTEQLTSWFGSRNQDQSIWGEKKKQKIDIGKWTAHKLGSADISYLYEMILSLAQRNVKI